MLRFKHFLLFVLFMAITSQSRAQQIRHIIYVKPDIKTSTIHVIDSVQFLTSEVKSLKTIEFIINKNLIVVGKNSKIKLISEFSAKPESTKWKFSASLNPSNTKYTYLVLEYSGKIDDKIHEGEVEYARGFSETSGIISEQGIYLAGATFWIPHFDFAKTFSFQLAVDLPEEWKVVSQGKRIELLTKNGMTKTVYSCPEPMDEIYIIAAKFTEFSQKHGEIDVQAFLRTPDAALSKKYLETTGFYLDIFEQLIGKYPFSKFALVENFWETGYGMPSFTLLGEKVIRFPWILHSSYPHELLHNWWGNSVYVNSDLGNWCEGITAYHADHMIKENQGGGVEYRRATLQKYTDFVNSGNDFPLKEFRSRNNPAQEAVGYGKSLMINHMLRIMLGDSIFIEAYRDFYKSQKFKFASFSDIRNSFEKLSGTNLETFFDQWIVRQGAPEIILSDVKILEENKKYLIEYRLKQNQTNDTFQLNVPVAFYLEGDEIAEMHYVDMNTKEKVFQFTFDKKPLRMDIDPYYDIFRRLDPKENPPALSQLMGEQNSFMILPSKCNFLDNYKKLAEMWQKSWQIQGKKLNIVLDSEINNLPTEPYWVIGFENNYAHHNFNTYKSYMDENIILKSEELMKSGSLVYVMKSPKGDANGFIGTTNPKAIEGLQRKLPHYAKYGYLGFEGDAPNNVLKGEFPIIDSPLSWINEGISPLQIKTKLPLRKALMVF